ncbi:MAG: heavy metal translocating P-type ATPase [Arenibacterium sp.]
MTLTMRSQPAAACPGCVAAPVHLPSQVPESARIVLSLPDIHCQACISGIEHELNTQPGVRSARVNLTLKRVLIDADDTIRPADLTTLLDRAGYRAHELDPAALEVTESDAEGRALLTRLAVSGFAAMNVMLLSVSVWAGAEAATRDMFPWISAAIALPATAYSAETFFRSAARALRAARMNMDVPIALAIVLALATSLWETGLSGEHAYFDAALTLTFFLLAGRYLDHRTRATARSAAKELSALEVPRATRLEQGRETEVAVSELAEGDLILVRPGGRIPVDGDVTGGHSEIDRSILTGESVPVFAAPGLAVSAGELNLTGPLTIRATAVGTETSLHRMTDLVAIAESGRARYNALADAAAKLYAPGVHILAALSWLGWMLWSNDFRTATNIAAAVLIITCPCALGLAVPAVTTAASGRLFRNGLLIKHATALERLAEVDHVVLDKTGTLTEGVPQLNNLEEIDANVLSVALALAQNSDHPLSKAIRNAMTDSEISPADVSDIAEIPGYGTEGRFQGKQVRLGRAAWVGAPESRGTTCAWLAIGNANPVAFRFSDRLRDGADALVQGFQNAGIKVELISGDNEGAVRSLAERVGIDYWTSNALPLDKTRHIESLTREGRKVLMIGDGLNDTLALTSAHVSISPASALDAARVASDIVLLGRDLSPVAEALHTARAATRRIRENFQIATLYNIVAVPLAVAGLATPLIAALAMSTSSITVSLNALRLRGGAS